MKLENILHACIIAFILTLLSGLYSVSPLVVDAEYVCFGLPFQWLEASRSTWSRPPSPWKFNLLEHWFIMDFAIYGYLAAVFVGIYEKSVEKVGKPKIYKIFFWMSYVALVACCFALIIWTFGLSGAFFREFILSQFGWDYFFRVESFLRFLLAVTTIIFSWFLIKYLKQFQKAIDSLIH
jgi:hypothetical protein